jgi:hypothetical protein
MCVGIESWENKDVPFWPQVNTATYKEVWMHSALRWLWIAADAYGPAQIEAYLPYAKGEKLTLTNLLSKQTYTFEPEYKTGKVSCRLPAGRYKASYNGTTVNKTLVAAKRYEWDGLQGYEASYTVDGDAVTVSIKAQGEGDVSFAVLGANIAFASPCKQNGAIAAFVGKVADANKPWVALFVPNGNVAEAVEVVGLTSRGL